MILDTNVVSIAMDATANQVASSWLDSHESKTLFITSVTIAEIERGITILPLGRKRSYLQKQLESTVIPMFQGRILPFDQQAASEYARRYAMARSKGIAVDVNDGYISGIAAANKMTVATRDTIPFEAMGVKTINPWES